MKIANFHENRKITIENGKLKVSEKTLDHSRQVIFWKFYFIFIRFVTKINFNFELFYIVVQNCA